MARKPVAIAAVAVVAVGVAVTLVVARSREPVAPAGSPAAPPTTGAPLASKAFYRVDPGPRTPCAVGSACEARLALTALGDYHVNKEYPFKFVGDPAPAVPLEGNGAFAIDDAKNGMMTVTFRPTAPGTVQVAGTFKLSVCSDDTCEIESPRLALDIVVQ
jgi:hypothetical protein